MDYCEIVDCQSRENVLMVIDPKKSPVILYLCEDCRKKFTSYLPINEAIASLTDDEKLAISFISELRFNC